MKHSIILLAILLVNSFQSFSHSNANFETILYEDSAKFIKEKVGSKRFKDHVKIYKYNDYKSRHVAGNPDETSSIIFNKLPKSISHSLIGILTVDELEILFKSENNFPMCIFFTLDTEGDVSKIIFYIHNDIASAFSTESLEGLRSRIIERFRFDGIDSKELYNYIGYGGKLSKREISSTLEQIINNKTIGSHE